MTTTLLLSPDFERALDDAHARLRERAATNPLAPTYLVLPRAETIHQFRDRLGTTLGVHLMTLQGFARRLLARVDHAPPLVDDLVARRLLDDALSAAVAADEVAHYAPMVDKPGFVQLLLELIRELRGQRIGPEDLLQASRDAAERELAVLYDRYESALRTLGQEDAEGLLRHAADALERRPELLEPDAALHVLGFDQLSPLQRRLLVVAAGRGPLTITLLWDPRRPADSLALTRLRESRDALVEELAPGVRTLDPASGGVPILGHLRARLFEGSSPAPDNEHRVRAVAAPSREEEIRHALREVKRLVGAGVPLGGIALLAPEPALYRRALVEIAAEYGVPLRLARPLVELPPIEALVALLHLAPRLGWRECRDALRSPYTGPHALDGPQLDLIDQLARERPVIAGRAQWREALRPLERAEVQSASDEDLGEAALAAITDPELLAMLDASLMAYFELITPPAEGTVADYVAWLERWWLGEAEETSLRLRARCAEGPEAARDVAALDALDGALDRLTRAEATLGPPRTMPWEEFRAELEGLLGATPFQSDETGLFVGPLEAGRARQADHLLLIGLAEGEFPRPPEPDLFFGPGARETHPLPLRRRHPSEAASLWWQVVGTCRETLWLSYPRLDERGAPAPPSPYWYALVAQVRGLEQRIARPRIGALPTRDEAASPGELLLALAEQPAAPPVQLQDAWRGARAAVETMAARRGDAAPGRYEGIFESTELVAALAERYRPERPWSVSRLNGYHTCPMGFFAAHVLRLVPRQPPTEGVDARCRGQLLHAILETLFRQLTDDGLPLAPASLQTALAHLDNCCDALFETAPERYGFRAGPLWRYEQAELRRMLHTLVTWECEQDGGYTPFEQELRFGLGSAHPALEVEHERARFRVHGMIDRIDRDGEGRLRLLDYKSRGSPHSRKEIENGTALQSALYALAATRIFETGARVHVSAYLHAPSRKLGGKIELGERGGEPHPLIERARERAATAVARTRAGLFPAAPQQGSDGACRDSCEYAAFCRADRISRRKAGYLDLAEGSA